ncbi:endocuticle structural glycoprotein SgAbd-8-like [Penaeus chinensis]|uniref:endocuticle structural glycoprotein SgAbd-8-like n=1 Tax=Penaeus chinensis TaxID=139456 RepID=UPI001FB5DBFD|nr:endocuticle structural glycoprotein SgAbd-8-like [Penaeus chinensis]
MSCSMYFLAALLLLSVLGSEAAESPYSAPIPILKDDRTQDAYGGYTFDFESGNGIVRQESGKESDGQAKEGGWRYESPEGVPVEISFVADQGGYQPQGAVIPVPPPLPYQRSGN